MANEFGFIPEGQASASVASAPTPAPVMTNELGFVADNVVAPATSSVTPTKTSTQGGSMSLENFKVPTLFPAVSGETSKTKAALKTVGNLVPSAINFGLSVAKFPLQTAKNIADISGEFSSGVKEYQAADASISSLNASNHQLAAQIAKDKAAGKDTSRMEKLLKSNTEYVATNKPKGGLIPTLKDFAKNLPSATYQALVPQAAQGLLHVGKGLVTGNVGDVGQGLDDARMSIENDPVGQILPFLMLGRQAAYKVSPSAGAIFDSTISNVANPVTATGGAIGNVISKVAGGATGLAGGIGRFATSQATGLFPQTVKTITENPSEFKTENMVQNSRAALGKTIQDSMQAKLNKLGLSDESIAADAQSAFDRHLEDLESTAKEYAPIRKSETPVKLAPDYLRNLIENKTGVTVGEDKLGPGGYVKEAGRIETTGSASVRDAGDVRGLQNFYNRWQPYFNYGEMTATEFLNMRSDLADLSKFERQIGKSTPLENTSKLMRGDFNAKYRQQLPGLEDIDREFSAQSEMVKALRQGLFDKNGKMTDAGISRIARTTAEKPNLASKLEDLSPGIMTKIQKLQAVRDLGRGLVDDNGHLTETAMNRIANATGKGKDLLLGRLEEISPGIGKRIGILKAIEDIENATGHKVGTYTRAAIGGGGLAAGVATGNLPIIAASIAEMIAASPEVAVPLMRSYGMSKALVGAVVSKLKSGASTLNKFPETPALRSVMPKSSPSPKSYR